MISSRRPMHEWLKSINGIYPPILENFFTIRKDSDNLQSHKGAETTKKNSNLFSIEAVSYKFS